MENEKFKSVLSRLNCYYREAEALIGSECSPNVLSLALKKINSYLSYLEKLVIKLFSAEPDNKDELNALKERVKNSVFNSKVTGFLECSDVTSMEIKSLLSALRTLRSQVSMSVNTTSIYNVALAKADEQVAQLKVTHLERQLDIEREEAEIKFKRNMEEYELKRKREMLLANQRAEEAFLKCQVLDEEIDHGCYIPLEPCTSDKIASQLDADAVKSLPTKKLSPLSRLTQNSLEVDDELPQVNTETTLADPFNPTLSKSVQVSEAPSHPLSNQSDRPIT